MLNENRFLGIFRGHNTRTIKPETRHNTILIGFYFTYALHQSIDHHHHYCLKKVLKIFNKFSPSVKV